MSKKVDFYAQQPHYLDHLLPIWNLLPEEKRGKFYVPSIFLHNHDIDMKEYGNNKNCDVTVIQEQISSPLIVAGGISRKDIGNSPLILVNHGAGQSYILNNQKRHSSYAGGENRDNVVLFIQPNTYAANLDGNKYPKSQQAVVGSCKLDKWHQKKLDGKIKKRSKIPVVAISFHWDCMLCPETKSTWEYYRSALPMLSHKNISQTWKILGHGHPAIMSQLMPIYKKYGIEIVEDFESVMERADLYIMDHMSTLYEFASTGRPVVVLNAPWYRKKIEHGLRYWECADVGINVEHRDELESAIKYALKDPLEQKMKRERALSKVYAYRDGMATERAVNAIVNFMDDYFLQPVKYKTAHQRSVERRRQEKKNKFKM